MQNNINIPNRPLPPKKVQQPVAQNSFVPPKPPIRKPLQAPPQKPISVINERPKQLPPKKPLFVQMEKPKSFTPPRRPTPIIIEMPKLPPKPANARAEQAKKLPTRPQRKIFELKEQKTQREEEQIERQTNGVLITADKDYNQEVDFNGDGQYTSSTGISLNQILNQKPTTAANTFAKLDRERELKVNKRVQEELVSVFAKLNKKANVTKIIMAVLISLAVFAMFYLILTMPAGGDVVRI